MQLKQYQGQLVYQIIPIGTPVMEQAIRPSAVPFTSSISTFLKKVWRPDRGGAGGARNLHGAKHRQRHAGKPFSHAQHGYH